MEEETDDSKGEGDMPDQDHSQGPLSHDQTPAFPLDPQSSPGGDSPMEDPGNRLEPGGRARSDALTEPLDHWCFNH